MDKSHVLSENCVHMVYEQISSLYAALINEGPGLGFQRRICFTNSIIVRTNWCRGGPSATLASWRDTWHFKCSWWVPEGSYATASVDGAVPFSGEKAIGSSSWLNVKPF